MTDFSGSNRTSLILCILITVFVIALFVDGNPTLEHLEMKIQDLMFQVRGEQSVSGNVVICALDDFTLDRTGWPIHRDSLAHLIGALQKSGAAVIVCDFDWSQVMPSSDPDQDTALGAVLSGKDAVVLPLYFTYADIGVAVLAHPPEYLKTAWLESFENGSAVSAQAIFGPEAHVADSARAMGGITPLLDPDRISRRSPLRVDYGNSAFPSSAFWAASIYWDVQRTSWWFENENTIKMGKHLIPTDEKGRLLINFRGASNVFTRHSAADYLWDSENAVPLTGKIVVLGPTGFASTRTLATRVSDEFSAIELTASTIETLIQEDYIQTPEYSVLYDLLVLLLLGGIFTFLLPRVTLTYRFIILGASLIVFLNLQYLLFSAGGWLTHMFYPALEMVFFMAVSPLIKTSDELARVLAKEDQARAPAQIDAPKIFTSPGLDDVKIGHEPTTDSTSDTEMLFSSPGESAKTAHLSPDESGHSIPRDGTEVMASGAEADSATRQMDSGQKERSGTVQLEGLVAAGDDSGSPDETSFSDTPPDEQKPKSPETISGLGLSHLGRYEVLEEIGRGAMGIVYRGIDPAINRPVALKTVQLDLAVPPAEKEELRARLLREAQAAGQLSHPNIVTVYDVGSQGDIHYIAMEYLKGYTLERAVSKHMSLNYKIFAKLMIQVCDALEFAHTNELVHRDIKPANIMVLDNFKVKVMDFGIAHMAHSNMTQTGVALGTPSYISPEQLTGHRVDRRSDIYSMGVVMYELLTKSKPFQGDNINKLIYNILNEKPRALTDLDNTIPEAFNTVCLTALQKDPKKRYQYASDVSRELKEFIASLAPSRTTF